MIPTNEMGVIARFANEIPDYWEILELRPSQFPDMSLKIGDNIYEVEFEYKSSNFVRHEHDIMECDFIICWEDDWGCGCPIPVVELRMPDWAYMNITPSRDYLQSTLKAERQKRTLLKQYVFQTKAEYQQLQVKVQTLSEELTQAKNKADSMEDILKRVANCMWASGKFDNLNQEDTDSIAVELSTMFDTEMQKSGPGRPTLPISAEILANAIVEWIRLPLGKSKPAYSVFSTNMKTSFPRGKEHLQMAREILDYLKNKDISFSEN